MLRNPAKMRPEVRLVSVPNPLVRRTAKARSEVAVDRRAFRIGLPAASVIVVSSGYFSDADGNRADAVLSGFFRRHSGRSPANPDRPRFRCLLYKAIRC